MGIIQDFFGNKNTNRQLKARKTALVKSHNLVKKSDIRFKRNMTKSRSILISDSDIQSGNHKIHLYRFLANNIPAISSVLWTWARLSTAEARFEIDGTNNSSNSSRAEKIINDLQRDLFLSKSNVRTGMASFLNSLFMSLYRDGSFSGLVTLKRDGSGIEQFLMIDPLDLSREEKQGKHLFSIETDRGKLNLNGADFYHAPLDISHSDPMGESILNSVPFVSYIEQQLVDDMRKASHNAGFHRLHVRLTPPERFSGESEKKYIERINNYFDDSVDMIKSLDVDDNPVTWDNVEISHISPRENRGVTNSWFMHHRAIIEEICAGTKLAPFLLGYSFGTTSTWAGFKFDMVMRQVHTVQSQVSHFMEWLGNIELALAGLEDKCKFVFDNSFPYQAGEVASIKSGKIDSILKLYQAGLINLETAKKKAEKLV